MQKDIARWCKPCVDCQQSKISRYNHVIPADFVAIDGRFKHVHVDIVGSLPESRGYRYLLTLIDRFSRWPKAVPLKDMEALTVSQAFADHWISRFSAPETLTTNQGGQFEAKLSKALLQLVGCQRNLTIAYHPASNGIIQRWYRSLKAALMCHTGTDWSLSLSTVLLGLRSNVMDIGLSPAEFVYGTTLIIPGDNFYCIHNF